MASLIQLSNTSWKQPFTDRRKEVELWDIQAKVKTYCRIKDKSYRLLNIKFEDKFGINVRDTFRITSGKEIRFQKKFQIFIQFIQAPAC